MMLFPWSNLTARLAHRSRPWLNLSRLLTSMRTSSVLFPPSFPHLRFVTIWTIVAIYFWSWTLLLPVGLIHTLVPVSLFSRELFEFVLFDHHFLHFVEYCLHFPIISCWLSHTVRLFLRSHVRDDGCCWYDANHMVEGHVASCRSVKRYWMSSSSLWRYAFSQLMHNVVIECVAQILYLVSNL